MRPRRVISIAAIIGGATLSSCGGTTSKHAQAASATRPADAVVSVGGATISAATYAHWMAIGAATREMPKPTGPLPSVVEYRPPDFTACVTQLRLQRAQCRSIYEGIQTRVLHFLITAYWLRGEAARAHIAPSRAEVRRAFQQERETSYPTAAALRRLQEASHQTVSDLEFAVESRLLSNRLLTSFTAAAKARDPSESEEAIVAAFNRHIERTWLPRTDCRPGYVVKDCSQFRG